MPHAQPRQHTHVGTLRRQTPRRNTGVRHHRRPTIFRSPDKSNILVQLPHLHTPQLQGGTEGHGNEVHDVAARKRDTRTEAQLPRTAPRKQKSVKENNFRLQGRRSIHRTSNRRA